jgi:hypothetical protein
MRLSTLILAHLRPDQMTSYPELLQKLGKEHLPGKVAQALSHLRGRDKIRRFAGNKYKLVLETPRYKPHKDHFLNQEKYRKASKKVPKIHNLFLLHPNRYLSCSEICETLGFKSPTHTEKILIYMVDKNMLLALKDRPILYGLYRKAPPVTLIKPTRKENYNATW